MIIPKEIKKVYKQISEIYIETERFKKIFESIEIAHQLSAYSTEPECLMILGISGVGKTSIIDLYSLNYPRRRTKKGLKVPVLKAIIPKPTTLKSVITHLLKQLGDPLAEHGTTTELKDRLIHYLKICGVQLIFLDEFQHLLDSVDTDTVSDWLKVMIEESKVLVVLFGLPQSVQVLEENIQLDSRFSSRLYLDPFTWNSEEGRIEFTAFLDAFETELPFKHKTNLKKYAEKIYYATDGLSRSLVRLLKRAALSALINNRDCIIEDDLADSYNQILKSLHKTKANPFYDSFDSKMVYANEYQDHLRRIHNPVKGINNRIKKRKKKEETFNSVTR